MCASVSGSTLKYLPAPPTNVYDVEFGDQGGIKHEGDQAMCLTCN